MCDVIADAHRTDRPPSLPVYQRKQCEKSCDSLPVIAGSCTHEITPIPTEDPEAISLKPRPCPEPENRGYTVREQHPFYRTSYMDYGQKPAAFNLPINYYPKDAAFTQSFKGFRYRDCHFTTESDKHNAIDP